MKPIAAHPEGTLLVKGSLARTRRKHFAVQEEFFRPGPDSGKAIPGASQGEPPKLSPETGLPVPCPCRVCRWNVLCGLPVDSHRCRKRIDTIARRITLPK